MEINTYIIVTIILLGITDESQCACDGALGIAFTTPKESQVPDTQLSASTAQDLMKIIYGRLNYIRRGKEFGVWCATEHDKNPWYQIEFKKMTSVNKIELGMSPFVGYYVETFMIKHSYDGITWHNVSTDGKVKVYNGFEPTSDKYSTIVNNLGTDVLGRYFRIYPLSCYDTCCLTTELYGCFAGKDCDKPIGISNPNVITNDSFAASSSYMHHQPSDGRLNNMNISPPSHWGAWCANENDLTPWLQIGFTYPREISKIATQGHPYTNMNAWVKKYKLNYSTDGDTWQEYNKVFIGNVNGKSISTQTFAKPFTVQYIRIRPLSWQSLPCLRVEIYECVPQPEFVPKLVIGLKDTTIARGEEFNLKCAFTGHPGITLVWHLNGVFLPTDSRISTAQSYTNRTMTATLQFKRIKGEEHGAVFTCLAWYPHLNDLQSSSTAVINVLAPIPNVKIGNISSTSSEFIISFTGPLTKDVEGYTIRLASKKEKLQLSIPFSNVSYFDMVDLHPYRNYSVEVAMLYTGDEVGDFYSRRKFTTLEDRPSGAPLDLHVTKIAHDTLHCFWSLPDEDKRNGIITHYEVRYFKSVKQNKAIEKVVIKYKLTNFTSATLYHLEAGANYEVSVRAFTKIGEGPFNHPPTLIFTGKATEELNSIKEMVITEGNAAAVGNRLKNITANPNFLNKHDVVLTIDILEKVVDVQNSSELLGESLVEAVSNVLKANKTVLAESEITNRTGTRYVQMLEKWLANVKPEKKKLEENSENVIVKKIFLHKYKLEEGIKFSQGSGTITIPVEALPKNQTDESIYFVYYKTNKFFTEKKRLEELCVNGYTVIKERVYTPVISSEIVGQKTQNLSEPVILKFKANETADLSESACVYWDFQADGDKGGWSSEGCTLESVVNQTITCHCTHLTNFAAMMDIYAPTSRICGRSQEILTYISIAGSFLSLIGLFLTFITYLLFGRLLKEMAAKVLIQLCVALFVVIVAFITGFEQTGNHYVCKSVAVVIHYFTLVAFMWMLMEAGFMYHAFVRVWPPREGGDIVKSSVVAWGIPFFIVLITFLTSMDKYGGNHYCHVTGIPLYAGYLAPIGLIICINFIIFVFIMHRLSTRPNANTDQSTIRIAFVRLRRAFGIMILMGLTWAFGFGSAIKGARLEFSYLFAIFNGLQGFAIFGFYCIAQKNARKAWYRFFLCDTRSDLKRNTDSYYERRRLSSATSNRTNTLQFNRMGSSASSVYQTPSRCNTIVYNTSDISVMNTIDEADSPINSYDNDTSPLTECLNNQEKLIDLDEMDGEESSAEDEVLNIKLRKDEHRRSKPDLKQYSSYRALSGATSVDMLNLAQAPSLRSSHKDCSHRKSAEYLCKKVQKPSENRKSMIEHKQTPSPNHAKLRSVKSLEYMIDREEQAIPMTDVSTVDLIGYRNINSNEYLTDRNTLSSNDATVVPQSNTQKQPDLLSSPDNGTLKSDAATMTDIPNKDAQLRPPLYNFKGPDDLGRSQEHVMQWLHDCEDDIKDTDSDYSSSYYKTSRSSSMTDLASPTRKLSSTTDKDTFNMKKNKEKQLLNNMVMGHLKSNNNNTGNRKKKLSKHSSVNSIEDEPSEFSENGYSASEEDIFDIGHHNNHKPKSRRKRSRQKSSSSVMKLGNQYMTLDEPSAHVSYV